MCLPFDKSAAVFSFFIDFIQLLLQSFALFCIFVIFDAGNHHRFHHPLK